MPSTTALETDAKTPDPKALTKGETMSNETPNGLLSQPIKVINVGLEGFAKELASQSVPVLQVQWTPPAGGDPKLAELLSKLGL
jgi:FdrA protein